MAVGETVAPVTATNKWDGNNLNSSNTTGSLRNGRSPVEVLTSSEKQIAYHTCVAPRQYFREHILFLVDSVRPTKNIQSAPRNISRTGYKLLDLINEAMDTVFHQMQKECFFRSFSDPDFITDYERARFFVIKSFSEDNIHKSIKYSVWASTPLGNRKLDAAYRESKDMEGICPVFLLFSVNASGQFCGVAEMIGHVDFENDADYWQQDRWSGQFPMRWGIIKDVPNNCFRHILLYNNDNKHVTHSRDSQEVKLEHVIEMLKIFKSHDLDTSLLEDFSFYDEREKSSLERKAKNRASSIGGNTEATESINQLSDNLVEALRLDSISKKDLE